MDLFKKILGLEEKGCDGSCKNNKTDNKKSIEDKFGFGLFGDAEDFSELDKHIEEHMKQVLKALDDQGLKSHMDKLHEEMFKLNIRGQINNDDYQESMANELNSFFDSMVPATEVPKKEVPRTDEEKFMDLIHDTVQTPPIAAPRQPRSLQPRVNTPFGMPKSGVFDGMSSPNVFRQRTIVTTIRQPDGSYEIKKAVTGQDGVTHVTITKSENGKEITMNSLLPHTDPDEGNIKPIVELDRTLYVNKDGYTLPRNLF
ncbi:uncharacterized protein LOC134829508 [Culicoides brevitarsis]|uniref:uncharacterized protein LOC134829508 n=1 Tax=Culicoides brevitarsis TaxID=469753 RepID=UPI00307B4221